MRKTSSVASGASRRSSNPAVPSRKRSSLGCLTKQQSSSIASKTELEEAGVMAHERCALHKQVCTYRLDPQTQRDVLLLFHKLKKKQKADVVIGNKVTAAALLQPRRSHHGRSARADPPR